ncbi:hypothetical protein HHL24_30920 [Paraburkholderia sp. RP-4-7]|uniref:Uncharacterized protein n=1 Tax=Paraburkholderia polaris TaxID=2728848 RepID=A0A848IRB3_9BURK|nr:hypothetical protein [Paraburkholderia polaris]
MGLLLQYALDIRKFEIELYWKRATYFWVLIAAAFTGHFVILGADEKHFPDKQYLAYIVACLGLVLTFAWYQANKGSKYWQENWENHVDSIEDSVIGPLYKTILARPPSANLVERLVGPAPVSVSKINQWVNIFTLFVWGCLVYNTLAPFDLRAPLSVKHVVVGFATGLCCVVLLCLARTHRGGHEHIATTRVTAISRGRQP